VAGDDETPAKIARAAPTVTPYFDAIRRKLKWGARSQSKENESDADEIHFDFRWRGAGLRRLICCSGPTDLI
jgi:hypothetical protein